MQQYLRPALTLLFQRLQGSSTPKYTVHLVRAWAQLVHARGVATLLAAMDAIQPGIFAMVLEKVWLPNVGRGMSKHFVAVFMAFPHIHST